MLLDRFAGTPEDELLDRLVASPALAGPELSFLRARPMIWASRAARVSRRLPPPPRKIGGCGRCAGLGAPSWPVMM
jgi:hypothetical protein